MSPGPHATPARIAPQRANTHRRPHPSVRRGQALPSEGNELRRRVVRGATYPERLKAIPVPEAARTLSR